MEKAIEIKRRAQRCIQNGDLDGALNEYGKLVAADDADPYNFVLLADLLYKKGDGPAASNRYLAAITAYEKAALYKNAIAVCKKMMRLSLSPMVVLERLASLHALDGLKTEASLYFMQYAEHLSREDKLEEAIEALRRSFSESNENIKALERVSELLVLDGKNREAAQVLAEAALYHERAGALKDADRCRTRAEHMQPGAVAEFAAGGGVATEAPAAPPQAPQAIEPRGSLTLDHPAPAPEPAPAPPQTPPPSVPAAAPPAHERVEGLEQTGPPRLPGLASAQAAEVPAAPVPPALNGGEPGLPEGSERGLDFDPPATRDAGPPAPPAVESPPVAESPAAEPPAAEPPAAEPVPAVTEGMPLVERLLAKAQEEFRDGNRQAASHTLAEAARAYDDIGRHDSAATIYRSLSKSTHASAEVLTRWLGNCERRGDTAEAAQVACELGDLALNEGDRPLARQWFERAVELDGGNEVAGRRLQRLDEAPLAPPLEIPESEGGEPEARAPRLSTPGSAGGDQDGVGRVEVALGRSEAVTFDLGSVISEFQRGVEAQLSDDAQSHYDLAMAYREMGLLEQAVESFRVAARDPKYAHRSAEMIGRCHLDQGRFDDAARELSTALSSNDLPAEAAADLRFQLGLAHEAAGRAQEALAEFERVYSVQPSYPDAALKIRALRKSLENV